MESGKIKEWLRHIPLLRETFDIGGNAIWLFSALFGAASMTALIGFIKGEPHFAIACAAIVASCGFWLFVQVTDWFRREDMNNILSFSYIGCNIIQTKENEYNVFVNYILQNLSDYKIIAIVEDAFFGINSLHAQNVATPAIHVLSQNMPLSIQSDAIIGVTERHEKVRCKLTVRFGTNADNMKMRWYIEADGILPPPISENPIANIGGFILIKNLFERIH